MKFYFIVLIFSILFLGCNKNNTVNTNVPTQPPSFSFNSLKVNDFFFGFKYYNVNTVPILKFNFTAPVKRETVASSVTFIEKSSNLAVAINITYGNNDSTIIIQPSSSLKYLTQYSVTVGSALLSSAGGHLLSQVDVSLITQIDSTDKFTQISDSALLDLVQKQTFKYFWDFGHPTSGLARERNTSGDVVTSGGSGFGIMAMVVAVQRNFITRTDAVTRMLKIVNFLTNQAQKYHGAFPHWMNGATGATVPFSTKDDGADLVETSYLMQGLLTARQYFNNTSDANEIDLRNKINALWNNVEWSWFTQGNQNVLYWHWSANNGWAMNVPIRGWNECLVTYVLAASSTNYSIANTVYSSGWAQSGAIKNGSTYLGITLPLGAAYGGPLFFAHYSFLGIDPNGLTDVYANYLTQNIAHTKINYNYCVNNPNANNGYSSLCWGLTASDISGGYTASSPTNDVGVIAPTAAISSMPYTPTESMAALKFFYYKLGDKIWKDYGFTDAFNLSTLWYADSFLAIDQGPMICMIENYRSKLLWNLFMSCSEVKTGMTKLGFTSPHF